MRVQKKQKSPFIQNGKRLRLTTCPSIAFQPTEIMTNIIFSFDTEDYINEYAAEGILRTAKLLRGENIKGCYQIVGLLAEALVDWGRQDIIDELRTHHEVDFHSHRHSHHPSINEYTDISDYTLAKRTLLDDELAGIHKVKRIFGVKKMVCACPPGSNTSYVARYAYSDLGFSIYTGDHVYDEKNLRPVFCANMISLYYHSCLDEMLFDTDEVRLREFLDGIASKHSVVIAHHPQRAYATTFCDLQNYCGTNTPKDKWVLSERYPTEMTEAFYKNFALLISLIKNDPRFRIITYKDLQEEMKESPRVITKEMLPSITDALKERFFPVTQPRSFSIADIFHACRELLLGKKKHMCKKVYGFLSEPYSVSEETVVTKDELIMAAGSVYPDAFLPEFLFAGSKKIGPADFIWASLAILSGDEEYVIKPNLPKALDLDEFPYLRDLSYKSRGLSKTLEDNFLSERLRLQGWTIRLPEGTKRFIM